MISISEAVERALRFTFGEKTSEGKTDFITQTNSYIAKCRDYI